MVLRDLVLDSPKRDFNRYFHDFRVLNWINYALALSLTVVVYVSAVYTYVKKNNLIAK